MMAAAAEPLPPGWTKHVSRQYKVEYYFHDVDQTSSWVHPSKITANGKRGADEPSAAGTAAGAPLKRQRVDDAGLIYTKAQQRDGWLMSAEDVTAWVKKSGGMIEVDTAANK